MQTSVITNLQNQLNITNNIIKMSSKAKLQTSLESSLVEPNMTSTTSQIQYKQRDLQPTLNIGTLGHVAHGKSTLVRIISGVSTQKHNKELERNMTIKLGYANAKIFQCPLCPKPNCYQSCSSDVKSPPACKNVPCQGKLQLVKHVSFVDCPGHDSLMATMLNGTAVMHAATIVIAGNEKCPQPQTLEHLAAADIMNLQNLLIIQNKIDLAKSHEDIIQNYQEIKKLTKDTVAENSKVIPISAQLGINVDMLLQYIVEEIPEPVIDERSPPRMMVIRSFDINKPGFLDNDLDLKGAVIGGSLERGVFRIGQKVELRPGIIKEIKDENNQGRSKRISMPIKTEIVSMSSEKVQLKEAIPGGLIGIGTKIDPCLGKGDVLVGQVCGLLGTLPHVWETLELEYKLMSRVVGEENESDEKKKNEKSWKDQNWR